MNRLPADVAPAGPVPWEDARHRTVRDRTPERLAGPTDARVRLLTRAQLRSATAAPRPHDGFTSRRLDLRGPDTHDRCATAAAGVPIVLLHGLAVSHRYLMPTARALAARHQVHVPDLPGFGLSGKPPTVYDVDAHARHLGAWLDRLGPACVLGHSYGAEVAARLAARHPHAVLALVLAGPTSDPAARTRRGMIGRWLRDLPREDPRQAVILARDLRDAGPRRVFATLGTSIRNAIEDDLPAVGAPTLLLRGSRDPVAPHRWLREAARLCGGPAWTATVPGAGHNVVTTAGTDVAALVIRFLAGGARGQESTAGQRSRAGSTSRPG